jgi:hypothetical protein
MSSIDLSSSSFFQFKYKRRVYKLMQINPKKLKQLHTKANLKVFMDMIRRREVDRIIKLLNKGMDPNFHDLDAGGEFSESIADQYTLGTARSA